MWFPICDLITLTAEEKFRKEQEKEKNNDFSKNNNQA